MAEQVPSEPPADAPNVISVVFKLPSGARIERRFVQSNSLIVSRSIINPCNKNKV